MHLRFNSDGPARARRLSEVLESIRSTGSYELRAEELEFGARLAWRNSPRCPGRIQWSSLSLRDCRGVGDLEGVFRSLCGHIQWSTNGGNIRPACTVFPQRRRGEPDSIRIWNKVGASAQ